MEELTGSHSKQVEHFSEHLTKFEQWVIKEIPLEGSAGAGCIVVLTAFITVIWQILPLIFPATKTTLNIIWLFWYGFGLLVTIYIGIRYSYFLLRYKWSWRGRSIFAGSFLLVIAAICIPILILTHR